jgi:class 3 adenylate cyclase
MSPLPLFGLAKTREMASQFRLTSYAPQFTLQGLVAGVDNLRPDVFLSAKFTEIARVHLANLIEQHGDVEQLTRVPEENPFGDSRYGRAHIKHDALPEPEVDYPAKFKHCLSELQLASLRQAREADDIQLDLLCRVGLLKFLRNELVQQFTGVLERCRENLKKRDERRLEQQQMVLRDRFLRFQVNKRQVLRRVAQDVLATLKEVERETVASTRQSLFGDREAAGYEVLSNRLVFPDSSQDPFLRAEHYALFGSFDRDPDLFDHVVVIARGFLKHVGLAKSDVEAGELLNVPENAKMLMFTGLVDNSPRGKAQKALTTEWMEALEAGGVMDYVVAAYETVPILGDYGALVSPQQLKCALILKNELRQVEELLETHNRRPLDKLHGAAQRVRSAGKPERLRYAARYFIDLSRFHRDVRKMEVLERALESVNVVSNERLRELSEINGTLYDYLLPEEQKPAEQRVSHHVVLKADIRDSTFLTRSLLERGLNPASFFSLNFFEPVNKLLPKYSAEKVFIEGDAVILTLLENEGQRSFGVARTCVLAREILNVVHAYNTASTENGLPPLEIGIGIAYQNSAPLYLMDGAHRIMISDALNLSDRLSACHKRARRHVNGKDSNPICNVLVFQTVDEQAAAEALEDFLLNYNVGGIHLPKAGFEKLRDEISLEEFKLVLPMPWGAEEVRFFRGLVPVGPGVFHPILVREGKAAQVEVRDFHFVRWASHVYYEVCSNPKLIAEVERQHPSPALQVN